MRSRIDTPKIRFFGFGGGEKVGENRGGFGESFGEVGGAGAYGKGG